LFFKKTGLARAQKSQIPIFAGAESFGAEGKGVHGQKSRVDGFGVRSKTNLQARPGFEKDGSSGMGNTARSFMGCERGGFVGTIDKFDGGGNAGAGLGAPSKKMHPKLSYYDFLVMKYRDPAKAKNFINDIRSQGMDIQKRISLINSELKGSILEVDGSEPGGEVFEFFAGDEKEQKSARTLISQNKPEPEDYKFTSPIIKLNIEKTAPGEPPNPKQVKSDRKPATLFSKFANHTSDANEDSRRPSAKHVKKFYLKKFS
jgi:hypothetical protein